MRRRHAAWLAAAIWLVSGCGSTSHPVALTGTPTLISDALSRLDAARTYHLVISYTEGSADFKADLHIQLPSDAIGTVSENGATIDVLQTNGKLYVHGQDFVSEYGGSYEGRLFGDRWILFTPDMLRTAVLEMTRLTALPAAFLKRDFHGSRIDHVVAAAQSTAELKGDFGAMYIEELPPHALVKVESTQGFVPIEGISNVTFELLEYDDPVTIQAPADFADPTNPATLPPQYVVANWNTDRCDQSGCGVKVTAANHGGTYPGIAPSTFTYTLSHLNHSLIDRCTGRIPVVANGKSITFGCRITSRAWQSFAYAGGEYYAQVSLDNPSYDG